MLAEAHLRIKMRNLRIRVNNLLLAALSCIISRMPKTEPKIKSVTFPPGQGEVCKRFSMARRKAGLSQEALAGKIGVTRDQIANVELERTVLEFRVGWNACSVLNANPLWLATGSGSEGPFVPVDISRLGAIPARARFTEIVTGPLFTDRSLRESVGYEIRNYSVSGDALSKNYEDTLLTILRTFLLQVPAERRNDLITHLSSSLSQFVQEAKRDTLKEVVRKN